MYQSFALVDCNNFDVSCERVFAPIRPIRNGQAFLCPPVKRKVLAWSRARVLGPVNLVDLVVGAPVDHVLAGRILCYIGVGSRPRRGRGQRQHGNV